MLQKITRRIGYRVSTVRSLFLLISLFVAIGVLVIVGTVRETTHVETGYSATSGRPFASWSPWNSAIRTNPTIDAKSDGIVSLLSTDVTNQAIANLYDFGIPIYFADASTPRVSVTCTNSPAWGVCPLSEVRVPVHARPHPGSDGALVIVDTTNQKSYEFWQAQKMSNTEWRTSWGAVADDVVKGMGDRTTGSSVAANIPRLAGIVTEREIATGVIPHALVFSSKYACRPPEFRYPASKTDGLSTEANCIPEGARIQLDPSINVDTIPGISAGEKAVAKALQKYGAYCVDRGGANMAFSFELPVTATPAAPVTQTYVNAGFGWDYYGMNKIPWNKLRVLSNWDGTST